MEQFEPREEKIISGPERTRGEAKPRFGRVRSKIMTPAESAAYNLNKSLENFEDFDYEERQKLQNEFVKMDNLKYMNMDALAATLAFLKKYPKPSPQNFKDKAIVPFIEPVISQYKFDKEEKKRIIIRYKAQILRYIRAINSFR